MKHLLQMIGAVNIRRFVQISADALYCGKVDDCGIAKLFPGIRCNQRTIGVNPDDIFEKAKMSYLDYYYKLFFQLRNPSAHSYGNIHFDLLRKQAVEAQCFAAIIIREYISTNMLGEEQAIDELSFNRDLLAKVSDNMSTEITK